MHAFLESYLNFVSEILHRKLLFGARMALEGALWTFLIGMAFAAAYEFCGWAGRFYVRLRAVDGRP